ncbi:hypothetical protein F5Y16DRAFT_398986 [Xylariaceae sp. FL0255]|nr:hypothetical protein F5Y16DRAFT_398986 [Xylariaceae sp. FL0255]
MNDNDWEKANDFMKYLFENTKQRENPPSLWPSDYDASDYLSYLKYAERRWNEYKLDGCLQPLTNSLSIIYIDNIVGIGLGSFVEESDGEKSVNLKVLAQHMVVYHIGKIIEDHTPGKNVEFGFKVLGPAYNKHEQFTAINNNTLFIAVAVGSNQAPMSVMCHYAKRAAMICRSPDAKSLEQERPEQNPQLWSKVTNQKNEQIVIPGIGYSVSQYTREAWSWWETTYPKTPNLRLDEATGEGLPSSWDPSSGNQPEPDWWLISRFAPLREDKGSSSSGPSGSSPSGSDPSGSGLSEKVSSEKSSDSAWESKNTIWYEECELWPRKPLTATLGRQ